MLLLLALAAGVLLPRPFGSARLTEGAAPPRSILLLSNPLHTDIALPLDTDVIEQFGFLRDAGFPIDNPQARFLVFGWGGREFYLRTPTWGSLEFGALARAFTLDASVMHVALASALDTGNPAVTILELPPQGYAAMIHAVAASFELKGELGLPVPAGHGYGSYDAFFEARGRFNAFLGCNTWTAAMLRAGGLQTGFWTPLPPLLRWSLRIHNDLEATARQSAGLRPQSGGVSRRASRKASRDRPRASPGPTA